MLRFMTAMMLACVSLTAVAADKQTKLSLLGTYETGVYNEAGAEISAYDAKSKRLFFINAKAGKIEILDYKKPSSPVYIKSVDVSEGMGGVNSVSVYKGTVAAAVESANKTDAGKVVFMNTDGKIINRVDVGALPDMLTFTPDGKYVVVANEGEPNGDYSVDPEGTVSIIDLTNGIAKASAKNLGFSEELIKSGNPVRIKSGTPFSKDAEPEYAAITPDSKYAYVTLQENNAIAKVDIRNGKILYIKGLGYKDHSAASNGMDAAKDKKILIENLPVKGMYMPDAVAVFTVGGKNWVITANEGDGREYKGYEDETKLGKVNLDSAKFPDGENLKKKYKDLVVSAVNGDIDGDGDFDELYTFGARSFTILDEELNIVYDSGDTLERVIASNDWTGKFFNASSTDNKIDSRSPKKGPEPEGIATAIIGKKAIVFVGLERAGGIAVFDVTKPKAPVFQSYAINRNFTAAVNADGDITDFKAAKDLAPEGLLFISAKSSPNGQPMLVVANEVSGTVSAYQVISE